MLLKNDLVQFPDKDDRIWRLLWIHPEQPYGFWIEIGNAIALPELVHIPNLEIDVNDLSTKTKLLKVDSYLRTFNEQQLPDGQKKIRDDAYKIVSELLAHEPAIYAADKRGDLIVTAITTHKKTSKTIYLYLRRYWQGGQTPNALLPHYANCGGKGKIRKSNVGVMRGRPKLYGDDPGVNVTPEIRKIFRVAVDRFYAKNSKFTLQGAYDEMVREFFSERTINAETGKFAHITKRDTVIDGVPTVRQFIYWVNQENDRIDLKRKRVGNKTYDKDLRGLLGTSNAEVWGPGSRYQIDATIADVYLVSRLDPTRIIGRPVLYVVIDVFSRMIVGIYIGLEGPSWVGAMMAVANMAMDKVAFCKQYGRIISPDEWASHHLPAILLGDRGEIEAITIEMLSSNFNVRVENSAPYRADWKGIVEQRFNLLPAKFKAYVPGYIEVDYRARGGKDYRLDAVLNIDEFTQIIIECILYYNNHHQFTDYDKSKDLAAANIPSVPAELWEWGIENRSGQLRAYPEDLVKFSLLPTGIASVTTFGIKFNNQFYTCQHAIENRWFDKARQNGRSKVRVSYDPRGMDEIYLHDANGKLSYFVCNLTERSRAYKNLSMWEVDQNVQMERHVAANHERPQQIAKSDLAANIEAIVDKAIEKQPDTSNHSNASRTKNIRENRAQEKSLNRETEVFRLGPERNSPSTKAQIISLPTIVVDDYSEPDITEIMDSEAHSDEP